MTNKKPFDDQARVLVVQDHQLKQGRCKLDEVSCTIDGAIINSQDNQRILDDMLAQAQANIEESQIVFECEDNEKVLVENSLFVDNADNETYGSLALLGTIDTEDDWQSYLHNTEQWATRHNISFEQDPFQQLMTASQRIEFEKLVKEEFTLKNAQCDKYDYMIAATCGLIGGLIDVLFVGLPGQGKLTHLTDDSTNRAVEKFASLNGWKGPREGSDSTSSAIGFLERNYKVNYDHRHGGDVNGLFSMSTKNHHIKNLAHSPDLMGLFFSLLDQFTSTAHFMNNGSIISVETETFELRGTNLVSKLFSGFVNWLGHLFSDVSGSSGAQGRGSGIPIPFYSLLQFINVGEFGQHKQTFAKISVQVFEQGYDFRHGLAMAIPVLVTELLTRVGWVVKQHIYAQKPWSQCLPTAVDPELRRMLLVAHGSLCLVDTTDAALRSGGDIIQFMLRSNLIAWARFGTLAIKELHSWYRSGNLDIESVDKYLEAEYRRMLSA
jgi:hypothetical protein